MNILVTLDSNYIYPLTVMLKSLMHNDKDSFFHLYVAHSTLTENDFAKIRDAVDESRVEIHPIIIKASLLKGAPILKRLTRETYYRLLLCEFLPPDVDRILYIDPDTVILKPLTDLYNIPMDNYVMAGAPHLFGFINAINLARLKMDKKSKYINAGVLLINVELMRKVITTEEIFAFIKKNAKTLYLADQDVINALFDGKILFLDARVYNLDEKTYKHYNRHISLDWVDRNTSIIHYNGSEKPWNPTYDGILNPYFDYYKKL